MNEARDELARVVRDHAGKLAASLMHLLGDFAAAEDLVQDAVETALQRWPVEGIPERPDAWLFTVARRRGLDVLRRQTRHRDKLTQLQWPVPAEPDDRLRLIFTCCHPALPRHAQIALTLRTVCGFTTTQIAAAFLVPETTVAQRITRAKRKITDAGIPYRIPDETELPDRLNEVLTVVYLLFNEGYLSSTAEQTHSRRLTGDAEWLTSELVWMMPREPEILGLLALIRLHEARAAARFDAGGRIVQLCEQDRSTWDHDAIAAAIQLLTRAAAHHRPGPYQLQAAILACHAEAPTWEDTDWLQILMLYNLLLDHTPSPIVRLYRAIALRYAAGAGAAPHRGGIPHRRPRWPLPLSRDPGRAAPRTRPPPTGPHRRPASAGAHHQPRPARAPATTTQPARLDRRRPAAPCRALLITATRAPSITAGRQAGSPPAADQGRSGRLPRSVGWRADSSHIRPRSPAAAVSPRVRTSTARAGNVALLGESVGQPDRGDFVADGRRLPQQLEGVAVG